MQKRVTFQDLTLEIFSASWRRPSSSLRICAACSSVLSNWERKHKWYHQSHGPASSHLPWPTGFLGDKKMYKSKLALIPSDSKNWWLQLICGPPGAAATMLTPCGRGRGSEEVCVALQNTRQRKIPAEVDASVLTPGFSSSFTHARTLKVSMRSADWASTHNVAFYLHLLLLWQLMLSTQPEI